MISALETIDWHSFLGRPVLPAPSPAYVNQLTGEPILVTGAGGSIGSALADRLARCGAPLILLDSSEANLFDLQSEFAEVPGCSYYLGRADDRALLDEIFALHHPRLVFHAAAFKHVPLLEDQPLAAISNNIVGTQTLAAVASAHKAHLVLLSTDKAVAPVSIMGATKRIAEQIVLGANGTTLRLGNVLASRGSVTEVFARKIAAGLPLTVTDPAARRYFVTLPEAVNLLLSTALEPARPALFVPSLSMPHYIADLARFMADTLAPDIEVLIEFTHLRPGDKETEQLWSAAEIPHAANSPYLLSIESPNATTLHLSSHLRHLEEAVAARDLSSALAAIAGLVPDYAPDAGFFARNATTPSEASNG